MSFTVYYNIKAVDQFSKVGLKIAAVAEKVEGSLEKLSRGGNKVNRSYKKLDATSARLAASQTALGYKVLDGSRKMNKASMGAAKLGAATASLDKVKTKLAHTEKKLAVASRATTISYKQQGDAMKTAGGFMLRSVVAPAAVAGGLAVKAAMDINKGMASVATLIPGNTERVLELKSAIQDLSIETGTSTGDLTAGAYAAISAWGDGEETIGRLGVTARAAKAGLASTEDTLALLSTMTEVYGDNSAAAAEHVADMAFVTNKLAIKAPFADMAASMGRVAPLAQQINVSQEELFATLAAGAGVTGGVAEVSTQMSSLYTSMIKETPAMEAVVKKTNKNLGTSFETAAAAMGSLGTMGFLKQIEQNTDGTKGFAAALGGRKEGLVLSLALLNSRTAKYNEALTEMKTKSGQMKVAFNEITNGVNASGEKWEKTKKTMMVFAQRAGEKLLPIAGRIASELEYWGEKLDKLDPKTVAVAGNVVIFAAKVGILLSVVGKLNSGISLAASMLPSIGRGAAEAGAGVGGLSGKMKNLNAYMLSFGVGWAIGDALNTHLVEPTMTAVDKVRNEISNAVYLINRDMAKLNRAELGVKEEHLKGVLDKANRQGFLTQMGTGLSQFMGEKQLQMIQHRRGQLGNATDDAEMNALSGLGIGGGTGELSDLPAAPMTPIAPMQSVKQLKFENDLPGILSRLGGGGGGGVFPYAQAGVKKEPQEILVKFDINAPEGTISNLISKSSSGTKLDLGSNLRD